MGIGNMVMLTSTKKEQNGKRKRRFGLEVLGRHYKSLGSSTVVALFKGIFVVDVPSFKLIMLLN